MDGEAEVKGGEGGVEHTTTFTAPDQNKNFGIKLCSANNELRISSTVYTQLNLIRISIVKLLYQYM